MNANQTAGEPLLRVRGLTLATRAATPATLLDDVSLEVAAGEVLALVGESGCGKTLTCLSLLGLQPHSTRLASGSARFTGVDLLDAPEAELRRLRGRRIAMIFQDPASALNPVHRIGDALARALARHRGLSGEAARAEARRLLDRVAIPRPNTRMSAFPHELSGGMNQRVMIALALTGQPDLLIADEPTTALDVTIQRQVLDLLREIQAETGMAMIFISHDLGVVAQVAHRVAVMYCGRVVETAAAEAIFAHPAHPYTAGLINSMPPDPRAPASAARAIRGAAPPLGDLPAGCHFHPRCDRAAAICATTRPPRVDVGAGRFALCHLPLAAGAPA